VKKLILKANAVDAAKAEAKHRESAKQEVEVEKPEIVKAGEEEKPKDAAKPPVAPVAEVKEPVNLGLVPQPPAAVGPS